LARRIKLVVGEGRTARRGLLRFVLEGEGFEVVREAHSVADLAIAVAEERPDAVVLDDGIGVVAVSMVHEAVPETKIVLVWPSAVVPIGGDARVEPAKILKDLGPTVRGVVPVGVGAAAGLAAVGEPADWVGGAEGGSAPVGDELAGRGPASTRPTVTRLQQRGRRLHPGRRRRAAEGAAAAVVALPTAAAAGEAAEGGSSAAASAARSEWNRRLGTLALSGAAAVSALVLAVALGGGRVPTSIRAGDVGFLPPGVVFGPGGSIVGPFSRGLSDGTRFQPIIGGPSAERPDGDGSGGTTGDGFAPSGGGRIPTADIPSTGDPGGAGGSDTGGGDPGGGDPGGGDPGGGDPGGGDPGGGDPGGGDPGDGDGNGGNGGGGNGGDHDDDDDRDHDGHHDDDDDDDGKDDDGNGDDDDDEDDDGNGGGKDDDDMPGKSEKNPFGGPPSRLGHTPAHGDGVGKHHARSAQGAPRHAHKH
jgi:hypothetical protein